MGLADHTGVHCPVRLVHAVADRGRVALLDHLVAALVRVSQRHGNQAAENGLQWETLSDTVLSITVMSPTFMFQVAVCRRTELSPGRACIL